MELTTKDWKEFRIGDLFDCYLGKSPNKQDITEIGNYPVISAQTNNNGIIGYTDCEDRDFIYDDKLTLGNRGSYKCFYQKGEFYAGNNVIVFDEKVTMNKFHKLFIAALINKLNFCGYTKYPTKTNIVKEMLLLPSKNDEPDWDFMEEFIKEIEEKYIENVDKYNQENIDKALSVTGLTTADLNGNLEVKSADRYEVFRVGDLFDKVEVGYKSLENFEKEISISNVKTDEFNLPLINAKDGNNGIMYYGKIEDWSYVDNSIDIISDGAVSTGNVYYQKQNTSVLYNAYLIKLKANYEKYNFREVLLYLTTKLQKQLKEIYHYQNKAGWNKVKNEKILLPAIDENTPDFDYMEKAIYIYILKRLLSLGRWITRKKSEL